MLNRNRTAVLLAAIAVVFVANTNAMAQDDRRTGGVAIGSRPPGAVVELEGEHQLSGVTPWRLDRAVSGRHLVTAFKPGYENWRGVMLLSPTRLDTLWIEMSPKTAFKAGMRSALMPGWGQWYGGQKLKGTTFFLAEAVALSGFLAAEFDRRDAEDDYDAALGAYDDAVQVEDIEEAYAEVLARYDVLEDKDRDATTWGYVAGGIWALSLIDAILLFPGPGSGSLADAGEDGSGPLFAETEAGRSKVGFAFQF